MYGWRVASGLCLADEQIPLGNIFENTLLPPDRLWFEKKNGAWRRIPTVGNPSFEYARYCIWNTFAAEIPDRKSVTRGRRRRRRIRSPACGGRRRRLHRGRPLNVPLRGRANVFVVSAAYDNIFILLPRPPRAPATITSSGPCVRTIIYIILYNIVAL